MAVAVLVRNLRIDAKRKDCEADLLTDNIEKTVSVRLTDTAVYRARNMIG